MHDRLLAYIRRLQLMRPGDRIGVAVSAGADSVALLRLLLDIRPELGVVLSVVHFNHKLRGAESDADEQFVRELAQSNDLEFFSDSADTRARADERHCGIEAAARDLRYEFFWKLLSPQRTPRNATEHLDKVATAHTMDDQAETVLMRFLRGAGTRGLSGIHPVLADSSVTGGTPVLRFAIVRPLLEFRRAQLRHYLKRSSQPWREDSSNADLAFTRNKLRHELLPTIREFNPAIEQVLSETAEIARAEEDYWAEQVERALIDATCRQASLASTTLDIVALIAYPLALQRRMIRALAAQEGLLLDFHHVQQILDAAAPPPTRAEKLIELPNGFEAVVRDRELSIRRRCPTQMGDYDLPLAIPGEVEIPAAKLVVRASFAQNEPALDAARLTNLRVRNWRPGDRYWPGHTSEPKKIKELLQSHRVPAEHRAHWPVVVTEVGGQEKIVWVPGFAFSEQWLLTNGGRPGLTLEHRVQA